MLAAPCQPGSFSWTGFTPCTACPVGSYQPSAGQKRCTQCPPGSTTLSAGRQYPNDCVCEYIELPPFPWVFSCLCCACGLFIFPVFYESDLVVEDWVLSSCFGAQSISWQWLLLYLLLLLLLFFKNRTWCRKIGFYPAALEHNLFLDSDCCCCSCCCFLRIGPGVGRLGFIQRLWSTIYFLTVIVLVVVFLVVLFAVLLFSLFPPSLQYTWHPMQYNGQEWREAHVNPFTPESDQCQNFLSSPTRNITSHSMENFTFHSLLRWKVIILQILATSLIQSLFERLGEYTFWAQEWKG